MTLAATQPDLTATVLFYAFALMAGGSALMVVVSRNVVRMAVALLGTLAGVAGLYFLLNAEFLAAVQLVVYAGGTLILIIFGVMLTSKSPFSRFEPKLPEIVIATSVSLVLLVALILAIPAGRAEEKVDASAVPAFVRDGSLPEPLRSTVKYADDTGTLVAMGRLATDEQRELINRAEAEAKAAGLEPPATFTAAVERLAPKSQRLFANRPFDPAEGYPVQTLGQKLLGDYLIPFELASVLLLVVMIGAAYLAKGRRREAEEDGPVASEASRRARQWS